MEGISLTRNTILLGKKIEKSMGKRRHSRNYDGILAKLPTKTDES